MHISTIAALIILVAAVLGVAGFQSPVPPLNPNTFTVSGISAGAAMSMQFEVAFSSLVRGGGHIAGLPYYCAQNGLAGALECMDAPVTINVNSLAGDANLFSLAGQIDALGNLTHHTVAMFSGFFDSVVNQGAMQKAYQLLMQLGVPQPIAFWDYPAEHAWITNFWGNSCVNLGSPFINNCGLDFAGVFLAAAYQNMSVKWNATRGAYNPSNMQQFDVSSFGASALNSLDTTAFLYVPQKCASSAALCHLHMNLHGCEQQRTNLSPQTTYVAHTGLNEWAEANNIVVFYPQTVTESLSNPNGCFDWWGYTGSAYALQSGVQMSILHNIVLALIGANQQ